MEECRYFIQHKFDKFFKKLYKKSEMINVNPKK